MRTYLEYMKISFKTNFMYKTDYIAGIVNNILSIFVSVAIWQAIYKGSEAVYGIKLESLITYITLAFSLQSIFVMDEFFIEKKIRKGTIATDLLKPINFHLYVFSYMLGTVLFKVLVQLLPTIVIIAFWFGLLSPVSVLMAGYFFLSVMLGYLVLYHLNFIFWVSSFWFHATWGIITIKDSVVVILSGVVFPIWFMPDFLHNFLTYTPFESIFHIPLSIYLAKIDMGTIHFSLVKQCIWLCILYMFGTFLWKQGVKQVVIQGG